MAISRAWRKRIGWGLAATAALAALTWAFLPSAVPVETAVAARGAFEQTVVADGKTRVKARYVVSAPLAGTLLRVALKPGDAVRPGMVLATLVPAEAPLLDSRSEREARERLGAAEAAKSRAEAAIEGARTNLDLARSEHARLVRLLQSGIVPAVEVERAEGTLRIRRKEMEGAEFYADAAAHEVELARVALSRLTQGARANPRTSQHWEIKSATAGRVLRVMQESEAVIAAGMPVMEVGDPGSLEVVVDVLSTDAVLVKPGTAAQIKRWGGGEDLPARARLVEPAAFTKVSALGVEEQRVNVILDALGPAEAWERLGDGFRVEAEIVVYASPDVLTVPVSALVRQGDAWAVFVVDQGRARLRKIVLGPRSQTSAVVQQGLEPGQKVVQYPSDLIHDGVRVTSH